MIRYYGHYTNVNRGRHKKSLTDDQIPYILEPELIPKEFRRNWARLIQKIYEVDPFAALLFVHDGLVATGFLRIFDYKLFSKYHDICKNLRS